MASQESIDMRALQKRLMLAPSLEPQPQAAGLGSTRNNQNVQAIGNGVASGDGRSYSLQLSCSLEAALGFKHLSQPTVKKMSTQGSGDKTQEFAEGELEALLAKGKAEREGYFQDDNDQTGHIDLLGEFHQSVVERYDEEDDDDFEGISQTKAEVFPESQRFLQPKTPATDGRKRAEPLTTPTLPINPFIGKGAQPMTMMGLSQVFNNTQPSSPFRRDLPSDMPSDLPSPAIFNAHRSPTEPAWSSPIKMANTTKDTPKLKRSPLAKDVAQDESSDDGFDSSEESLLRRRKQAKRRIEEQTKKEFAMVTAPSRESGKLRGKGREKGIGRDAERLLTKTNDTVVASGAVERVQAEVGDETTEDETDDDGLDSIKVIGRAIKNGAGSRPAQVSPVGLSSRRTNVENTTRTRKGEPTEAVMPQRSVLTSDPVAVEDSQRSASVHTSRRVEVENSQPLQLQQPARKASKDSYLELPELPSSVDSCILATQTQNSGVISSQASRQKEVRDIGDQSSCLPQPPSSFQEHSLPSGSPSRPCSRSGTNGTRKQLSQKLVIHSSSQNRDTLNDAVQRSSPPQFALQNLIDQDDSAMAVFSAGPGEFKEDLELPGRNVRKDRTIVDGIHDLRTPLPTRAHILTGNETTIPETSPAEGLGSRFPLHEHRHYSSQQTPMPPPKEGGRGLLGVSTSEQHTMESSGTTLFETAQSNIDSPLAAQVNDIDQNKISTKPASKSQVSRVQSLSELATEPTDPGFTTKADLDPILADDQGPNHGVSQKALPITPAAKRRKGVSGSVVKETGSRVQALPNSVRGEEQQNIHHEDSASIGLGQAKGVEQPPNGQGQPRPFKSIGKSRSTANTGDASVTARNPTKPSLKIEPPATPKAKKKPEKTYAKKPATIVQKGKAKSTSKSAGSNSHSKFLVPNRVLALFRDQHMSYYPATCLLAYGTESSHSSYMIRFDDGSEGFVDSSHVRRMELKAGDIVKIDEPNMRKNYIVTGFSDKLSKDMVQDFPLTDARGHFTILLRARQRDSSSTDDDSFSGEEISVPMSKIYLLRTMWHKFSDRTYTHLYDIRSAVSGGPGPTSFTSGPSTPARSHRMSSAVPGQSPSSVTPAPFRQVMGIFSGMVFAVTYLEKGASKRAETEAEREKEKITELILNNGGKLLGDGFEELFEADWLAPAASINGQQLRLKANSKRLGFACAIANDHSRKPKFMGALALGLPCLHGRWILDCAAQNAILDWEPYLLAAGKSAYLGDAARSRTLQAYGAVDAELGTSTASRPNFLHDQSIMLVTKNEARRNQFLFLVYALGASRVGTAANLPAAKKLLAEAEDAGRNWDWVCVEEGQVRNTKNIFAGAKPGRKRKRVDDDIESDVVRIFDVKVMSEEHVMQSLIMGKLLEENSIGM